MQAKDHTRGTRRITTLVIAVSTIFASVAQAADPGPPSCLSTDGSPPEPGATCCESTPTAYADENGPPGNGTVIRDLAASHDTFHSIGFVWDIDGDSDHDGSVSVRYRKAGACNFAPAMPLIRNDYAWSWQDERAAEPANNFAGSLMFLTPGTTYEVVLELSDPDGGRAIRVSELTNRAIPRKPTSGRTLYVMPGSGGGDGSSENPFRGIDAANAAALPGDRMLLRDGIYRMATLTRSGAENNYIVYEPDTGQSPVVDAIAVDADHIWIDNLTFTWNDPTGGAINPMDQPWRDTSGIYVLPEASAPDDVIITDNTFAGFVSSIISWYPVSRWVAMDNTIIGHWNEGTAGVDLGLSSSSTGKGIALGGENTPGGPGVVIAYNSITRVTDGMGANADSDVYGNQVWDIRGNAFSSDGAWGNVRVWGNRFTYSRGAPVTLQPQKSGPWYYLYNQMADSVLGMFKWRVQDRVVFINNTFMGGTKRAQYLMKTVTKNNLFIGGAPIWVARDIDRNDPFQVSLQSPPQWLPSWNTDVDYNGFDWGGDTSRAFSWFNDTEYYPDLPSFAAAVGIEQNGVRVNRNTIFENYFVSPDHSLTLNPSSNAVDAGTYLPNLADFFKGSAPDLGAHESGAPPLHYGPRSGNELHERELHWARH